MRRLEIQTHHRSELVDITHRVQEYITASGVSRGVCRLRVPHTTAAITLNENADPDVPLDLLSILERLVPRDFGYRHAEGNSDAHAKSSLLGTSLDLLVEEGRPLLGRWQGIQFCEFDGPRRREIWIRIDAAPAPSEAPGDRPG